MVKFDYFDLPFRWPLFLTVCCLMIPPPPPPPRLFSHIVLRLSFVFPPERGTNRQEVEQNAESCSSDS